MRDSLHEPLAAASSDPHPATGPGVPPPDPEVDPGKGRADEKTEEGAEPEATVDPVDKGDGKPEDGRGEPDR